MYIPVSLGIATLFSLLAILVGQVITLLKLSKLQAQRVCGLAGVGVAAAAASKAGLLKPVWEFFKLTWEKVKDKFKDKAADKIADHTVETVHETVVEEPKKT